MRIGMFPLWASGQIGGISTYDAEIVPALARLGSRDEFHIYRPAGKRTGPEPRFSNLHYHTLVPASRWINVPVSFPLAALFSKLDLVHMTHVPPPIFPKPYVMTLHCFSTFLHPEFYPRLLNLRVNALIRRGLAQAKVVICPSEGLRALAETELGVKADRLAVAPHGVSPVFRPRPRKEAADRLRHRFGIEGKFLLFVGVLAPRKNGVRMITALHLLRRMTGNTIQLVIVGRNWLGKDVAEAIARHELKDSILFTGHVLEEELADLYSAAELLVFPSLWESFGLPVIESMACGTPVLTSNGSCLPEVGGEAALYVDPYQADEIADGMARILNDPELASSLREKGFAQAAKFAWSKSAQKTLAAYRLAASRR